MGSFATDLKSAVRRLAKSPLFVAVAALTLALGIGLNATIFTFVDAVLLRPLPVADPDQLVAVFSSWPEERHATSSRPDWQDLRASSPEAASLFGHSMFIATLQQPDGRGELIVGELATGNFFDVLGIPPVHGRMLTLDDDVEGAGRVAVVSWKFFEQRLAADPSRLGTTVRLNGQDYEVVGVAPERFAGMMPGGQVEMWAPSVRFTELDPVSQIHADRREADLPIEQRRAYRWLWLNARLSEGTTGEQLQSRLASVFAGLEESHPISHDDVTVVVLPESRVRIHPDIDGVLQAAALALTGLVGLVLLVACANLANMLLARAVSRRREVAVRLALGAGRLQVVRIFVLEMMLVALLGGAMAVGLAQLATRALLDNLPPVGISFDLAVGVDSRILLFTVALSLLAGLMAAILPAFQASRPNLVPALKEGVGGNVGGSTKLRGALVMAQVAVSTVLLVASGLVLRGMSAAESMDLGYQPQQIATFGLNLSMQGWDVQKSDDFLRRLTDRVAALPGIESASLATRIPLTINYHASDVLPDSRQWQPDDPGITVDVTRVDGRYFETLDVPILRGRAIADTDVKGGELVAVVSQAAATKLWPGEEALGRTFRNGDVEGPEYQVVGISADYAVRAVGEEPRPMVHTSWYQAPTTAGHILARARSEDAAALLPELRRLALDMDPTLALVDSMTLEGLAGVTLYPVRAASVLLGIFAVLGLFLAAVGLYGVVAYAARSRQREMGVRVALGAGPGDVVRLLLGRGMVAVIAGCALGLAASAFLGQALSGILYGRSPVDPVAFLCAASTLLLVALLANAVPALRAARRDPLVALREE